MKNRRKQNKILSITIMAVIILSTIAPYLVFSGNVVKAQATNLIENGGFELGDLSEWDTGGNEKFQITDTEVNSGDYALRVSGPQDWSGVKHTVTVTPNTNYTLTFYGKGGGGAAYKVLGADETTITENYTNTTEEWTEYTIDFNSGDDMSIIVYVSDAAQTAYYDDFKVEQVLENVIDNGGFETGDLAGWDTGGNEKFQVTNVEAHSGANALEISNPQDWNGIKYNVEVTPNIDYKLSFYGKGGGGAAYKVLAADEATITENYTSATEEWTEYTVDFNSGENESVIIYVSDAGQTAYYDDFYIGDPVLPEAPPEQPMALNAIISGEAKVTSQLTGSFEYTHPEGLPEGYSMYSWLQSDAIDGEYKIIPNETEKNLLINEELVEKFIKLKVTPIDSAGTTGESIFSGAIGPVESAAVLDELIYQIDQAKILLNTSVTGTAPAQYPEAAWNGFQQAIISADTVAANTTATEDEHQTSITALKQASTDFENARNKLDSPFKNFISTEGTKLVDGAKELKFVSYNYPGALFNENEGEGRAPTAFEQEDAIRTIKQSGGKVFRTYSLNVRDKDDNPEFAKQVRHIVGPGEINEEAFRSMDKLLQLANEYEVRVIIPFIDNWDWPHGGITDFAYFRGKERLEFYTDPQLKEDFKQVLNKVMNRVNTYTGVKYKDDPAILGWETGNELMTAPEWMTEIAAHYKSINTNQLLISGNQMELPHFYRNISDEALTDPNIDVVKSHYYEGNYANKVKEDKANATAHGKPFFVGEFGFKQTLEIEAMLNEVINNDTSGALIWSLRPHSYSGGFIQHEEYEVDGILYRPYHWPGMPSGDYMDATNVVHLIRDKAYEIQGEETPEIPTPSNAPEFIETDSISELRWRGSTGASSYTIERAESASGPWSVIGDGILDDVHPGETMYADTTAISEKHYYYRVKGVNRSGASGYSNILGPVEAKYMLEDNLEDSSKQYFFDDESVVYRTPSSILSFVVDGTINVSNASDFRFYLSENGIDFTEVFPEKIESKYQFKNIDSGKANHLKILYPDGNKESGELTNVLIEYFGDGSVLKPVSPLVKSGILVDNMDDYSNMSRYSDNLKFDQKNQELTGDDTSKLMRSSNGPAFIEYRSLGDMTAFKLETYSEQQPVEHDYFTFSVSSDGEAYTEVEVNLNDLGGDWYKTNYNLEELPEGTKFLRVNYPDETVQDVQISKLQIAVGTGEIKFANEATPDVVDNGEHYGGEGLLLSNDYQYNGDVVLELDEAVKSSGDYGLKLDFSIGLNEFVSVEKALNAVNRSAYDTLQFWVMPDGHKRDLTLQLTTTDNQVWTKDVTISGAEPTYVNVSISSFENKDENSGSTAINLNQINGFKLSVNTDDAPTTGTLYFDDIRFVQTETIDNFDNYTNENEESFATRYGTRNEGGGEITGSLTEVYKESGTHSMQIDYDMTGPGYAGMITQLPHVDWSAYDVLSLWVKSAESPVKLTVQLKTGSNEIMEATRLLEGGSVEEQLEIPFEEFDYPSWYGGSGTLDPSEIVELNLYMGLESEPVGTIYVDSIQLIDSSDANENEGETPGEEDEGETPGGENEGETPGEENEGETPGGENEGETPGEENEGETPGEEDEDETPGGENEGETPGEEDEGETPGEEDEGETPRDNIEIELEKIVDVKAGDVVSIKNSNTKVILPDDLPVGTTLSVKKVEVDAEGLEQAGDVFEFNFNYPANSSFDGSFILSLGYDEAKYDTDEVNIYYLNENSGEWELQGGSVHRGVVKLEVKHFSTYGVFAIADDTTLSDPTDEREGEELPNTSTDIFNLLFMGALMLLVGFVGVLKVKKIKQ